MKLKTFRGRTMSEALDLIKREFGREAVILTTRTLTKGGVFGVGSKPYVEITAARHLSELPPRGRAGTTTLRSGRLNLAENTAGPTLPSIPAGRSAPTDRLLAEVGTLKSLVHDLVRETRRVHSPSVPGELLDHYTELVRNAVAEGLAGKIVTEVRGGLPSELWNDRAAVRARIARCLVSMLPTAGPIGLNRNDGPTVVALVGPTGVGKTTTVAKLAANFSLRERRRVGLVTIDTYRIAAVEQLKTYAEIMNIPISVVMDPKQLKEAVTGMKDRDIILVDTAGRSQRDAEKIQELKGFFEAVKPHEVHLVLSSACGEAVLTEAVERFREVGFDRLLFTKLDEAIGFGVILTCLQKADARLSYVTVGQDVPDDIEVGEAGALTRLILGEGPANGQ